MQKKTKKPRIKKDKKDKEKKDKKQKNVNKNKQSIKINISSSGSGAGGSGGGGPMGPTNIPNQVLNSLQAQKTGENVEIKNLLKQLDEKQQSAINNFAGLVNNSLIPAMMQNNQNNNARIFEQQTNIRDTSNDNLFERIAHNNNPDINDEAEFINDGVVGDEIPAKEQSLLSPPPPPKKAQPLLQLGYTTKRGRGRPKKNKDN